MLALFAAAILLTSLVGDYLFSQKVNDEKRVAGELSLSMAAPLADRDAEALYEAVLEASRQTGGRILVLDEYGVVQADTYSEYNGAQLRRVEVSAVLSTSEAAYGFYSSSQSGDYIASRMPSDMTALYAAPILSGQRLSGVLVFVTMAQEIYNGLMDLQTRVFLGLALAGVAVGALTLLIGRYFDRPVVALSEGITRMTAGDFSTRVKPYGKRNEYARLATAFNMMCERLENLDQSRNQFVSNASHELKTPLSTIKILIETLLYQEPMDEGMCREFLGDINKELDRLNSIINDQLTLASMDGGEKPMDTSPTSLSDIVGEAMARLKPLARERGIEMEGQIAQGIVVNGDAMRLTQVVYNLVDNAIKYTPRSGSVHVELTKKDKKAYVRVTDTGIGIPKEDQAHIFDRFYRVDKARSRETGGTGLGLSIARQLARLHGGDITVTSKENEGSTFIVELPLSGGQA